MSGSANPAALLIGGSAGAIQALPILLRSLPATLGIPVVVVLHRLEGSGGTLHQYLGQYCALPVIEIQDKEPLHPGRVYLAPAGYHVLLEEGGHCSLSVDPRVSYSRPSIDVLFETAADLFGAQLIGIILTGANSDGAAGLRLLDAMGGLALVQDPASATVAFMPNAALQATPGAQVLSLEALASFLCGLPLTAVDNECSPKRGVASIPDRGISK